MILHFSDNVKKKTYILLLLWALILFAESAVKAQDMQFSQAYSNPVHINPAMAGTTERNRFVLNYRNQWPSLQHSFRSFSAGSDHYLKNTHGGIGVNVHRDVAGASQLTNTLISMAYSQHVKLTRKSTLAIGLKGSLGQRAFDGSRLLFADQVIRESSTSLSQQFLVPNHNYGAIGAGLLYFRKKSWIGVSAHNINGPNQSLMGGSSQIPRSYSVHGGTEVPVADFDDSYGAKKLRVAFNYKAQGNWDQLDLGGFFSLYGVNFGLWYRGLPLKAYKPGYANHEAIVAMVGYEASKRWSIGYSYDITISRLVGNSGGAHEIALIYEYGSKKSKKRRVMPCAKF